MPLGPQGKSSEKPQPEPWSALAPAAPSAHSRAGYITLSHKRDGAKSDERVSACGREDVRGGATVGSIERGYPASGHSITHVGWQGKWRAL